MRWSMSAPRDGIGGKIFLVKCAQNDEEWESQGKRSQGKHALLRQVERVLTVKKSKPSEVRRLWVWRPYDVEERRSLG